MKTIAKPFQTSIDIKKSQFICRLFPAQSEKEAKEIIKEISEKYKDATHNCTACNKSNKSYNNVYQKLCFLIFHDFTSMIINNFRL